MNSSVEVSFRHMNASPTLEQHVRQQAATLDLCRTPVQHCHVIIDGPNLHCQDGREYHVHVFLRLPERDLQISRSTSRVCAADGASASLCGNQPPLDDVYLTVRDAFATLRHELEREQKLAAGAPGPAAAEIETI